MNPADRMETVQKLKIEIEKLQGYDSGKPQSAMPAAWENFVPPGFRTKTPWKMLTASAIYLFIFWLCLSLEIEDVSGFHLWLERITVLCMMLSIVFCCFNYRNVQQIIPLCTNEHWIIRCLGVLILNFTFIFLLFFAMFLLESFF